jgi:biotin operon repressor
MTGHEWKAFRDVLFGRELSDGSRLVGMYILSYRNPANGLCFPSMARIARDMGKTRVFVQRHVDELVDAGVLLRTRRQRHNEYQWVACPNPGTFKPIEDASVEELREICTDARRRALQKLCKVDRVRFKTDTFRSFEAVKDEYCDAELNGGWPAEYVYTGPIMATAMPF